jgi:hypothetical protein
MSDEIPQNKQAIITIQRLLDPYRDHKILSSYNVFNLLGNSIEVNLKDNTVINIYYDNILSDYPIIMHNNHCRVFRTEEDLNNILAEIFQFIVFS